MPYPGVLVLTQDMIESGGDMASGLGFAVRVVLPWRKHVVTAVGWRIYYAVGHGLSFRAVEYCPGGVPA
jgi:N6-adenosine-specific RNA methylase IME4